MSRRFLSTERKQFLGELAEAVAEEQSSDRRTDPLEILKKYKITSSLDDYGDHFDGLLECEDGSFHVFCNTGRSGGRQSARARFTLAHELGHYFIDEHRHALLSGNGQHFSSTDFKSKNLVEQEADHFASCLLLPPRRFREELRGSGRGLQGVLELKEKFGASITATAIRYIEENSDVCALIKWDPDGFGWKWLSLQCRASGYRKTIESIDKIPTDSSTSRILAGEPAPSCGYHECGATASFWFRFVGETTDSNLLLKEQAISLGDHGVLTLLFPA